MWHIYTQSFHKPCASYQKSKSTHFKWVMSHYRERCCSALRSITYRFNALNVLRTLKWPTPLSVTYAHCAHLHAHIKVVTTRRTFYNMSTFQIPWGDMSCMTCHIWHVTRNMSHVPHVKRVMSRIGWVTPHIEWVMWHMEWVMAHIGKSHITRMNMTTSHTSNTTSLIRMRDMTLIYMCDMNYICHTTLSYV